MGNYVKKMLGVFSKKAWVKISVLGLGTVGLGVAGLAMSSADDDMYDTDTALDIVDVDDEEDEDDDDVE